MRTPPPADNVDVPLTRYKFPIQLGFNQYIRSSFRRNMCCVIFDQSRWIIISTLISRKSKKSGKNSRIISPAISVLINSNFRLRVYCEFFIFVILLNIGECMLYDCRLDGNLVLHHHGDAPCILFLGEGPCNLKRRGGALRGPQRPSTTSAAWV